MKLKERPLDYWQGKRFTYWCRADLNDVRLIHYTLHLDTTAGKSVQTFTSAETVDHITMARIRRSIIRELNLINNEWHVVLDC